MNIGIIIGVGEYSDPSNNLPGCQKDAVVIHDILINTGKYDDILYINEKLNSAVVKEQLTEFITDHKKDDIDELFLYYTGHGEFFNHEFYFLLSDYTEHRRKQTSLQNEEVDNLIRTLRPDLVIKVIDACQSGTSYIKEANGVSKYFEKTQDRFKRCYFFNSSLNDQSSYQTDVISDFTRSFISSIRDHNSAEIRYKDIIDFISDEFEGNASQTPYFVIQADYTEKFCSINGTLKEYLKALEFDTPSKINDVSEATSLLEAIKKRAEDYSGKEEALILINNLKENVQDFILEEDLENIFELEINFYEDYSPIVKRNAIGKWLDDNDHDFFAQSRHKKVRKDRHTNPFSAYQAMPAFLTQQNDEEYEWVRNGFDLDIEVPYKSIVFDLNSQFPNVDSFTCRMIYLLSKREVSFFYFITNFEEVNWDKRALNSEVEWLHSDFPIGKKEEVEEGVKKIFKTFQDKVITYLKDEFDNKEKRDE